jgi:hypothetical protein
MHRLATWVLAASVVTTASAAPVWVTPKHRAAPPSEMLAGGPLAPVSPADVPLWSRAAMLRVDLDDNGDWQGALPVDVPGDVRIMAISDAGDDLQLTLNRGVGRAAVRLTPDAGGVFAEPTEVPGIGRFTGYTLRADRAGTWQARVDAPAGTRVAYLVYATESSLGLRSARVTDRTVVGQPMTFRASVHDAEGIAAARRDASATMIVTTPDGERRTLQMEQRGGEHIGTFTPEAPGRYVVQTTAEGADFFRTAQHVVSVVPADIALANTARAAATGNAAILRIDIDAEDHGRASHCRVTAQVWGRDGDGNAVPVCWTGGMAFPDVDGEGGAVLSLDVDARWIALAGAAGPFELRNVEVRCPDTMALLSGAEAMPLTMEGLLPRMQPPARVLTDMQTAPRNDDRAFPVDVEIPLTARVAGGHNLLLIHGYCAGGNPWPLSDFTGGLEIFGDPNANRSHDQFALLIKALGDGSKSFGVVAHSQGGCASLHLFTYYFSGLDWAEGPRLIQSLGTPYQGTPLAGDAASLGDIFGSGCGENTDLSVDGAAIWLGGIPGAARARVHYWTTSFSGLWCNFFSGLLLSNPEDGVIEVARGQLPGANNMGNTVGQCHTTGMSNPPQYQDSTRNAEMNTNAAR